MRRKESKKCRFSQTISSFWIDVSQFSHTGNHPKRIEKKSYSEYMLTKYPKYYNIAVIISLDTSKYLFVAS